MDRIVYVQEDHFEVPEELLRMSHEELRAKIAEERRKELDANADNWIYLKKHWI